MFNEYKNNQGTLFHWLSFISKCLDVSVGSDDGVNIKRSPSDVLERVLFLTNVSEVFPLLPSLGRNNLYTLQVPRRPFF